MTLTTYSIHRAYDHAVVVTASGINLQTRAQALSEEPANHGKRFYVHNGKGVVAAMLVKPHGAFDLLRDDYLQFNQKARDLRTALGLAND
jgi:hypothetical protein